MPPRLPALLLVASFAALTAGLLASSPPGSAPDEYAHYLRAAAAGRGQLVLDRDPPPLIGDPDDLEIERWMDTQDRLVTLPARLAPDPFLCWAQPYYVGGCDSVNPDSSEPRDLATYVGSYPPYAYVIPGLAMRLSSEPIRSLYLGRAANLALCLIFLAVAVSVLHDPGRPSSLAGIVAAASPMVLYVMSTLGSSSVEVAAGVCFVAALLRISRPGPVAPGVWLAAAGGGCVLALVRDLGPLWVLLGGALFLALTGVRPAIGIAKSHLRPAVAASAAVAVSIGLALWWRAAQGAGSPPAVFSAESIRVGVERLPYIAHQAVGIFGPLDTPLPWPALVLWAAIMTGLIGLAIVLGTPRQRTVLGGALATLVVLAVAAEAIQHETGFRAQARHLMPAAVALPMLAGEIVYRHAGKLRPLEWPLAASLAACAAAGHLIAWHTLGRRFSVGLSGPLAFWQQVQWRPVLGWEAWGALAAAGAVLMIAAAVAARRPAKAASETAG